MGLVEYEPGTRFSGTIGRTERLLAQQ